MRAIVLAAGRGSRLRPLTDSLPKPLIQIQGKALLDYQLDKLRMAGCTEVLINLSWLADRMIKHIESYKGHLQLTIQYEQQPLETGGGILKALPWLCQHQDEFIAINADIRHDVDLAQLSTRGLMKAQLVLSDKISHNAADFDCIDGQVVDSDSPQYVFTGISCIHKSLFDGCTQGIFPLRHALIPAIRAGDVGGLIHTGEWADLGTFDRLNQFADRVTKC